MWDFLGNLASAGINAWQGDENRKTQQAIAQQNIAAQREFAQMGIRWKVADATAAGLHPLAALGASTNSFSPVSVGSTDYGSMGQDIGRAIASMKTKDERGEEVAKKAEELTLEKGALENDLLRSQIRRLNSTGTGPGIPTTRTKSAVDEIVGRTVSENAPVKADKIEQKAEDFPATKVGRPFGYPLQHNPYFGDGQSSEDRYGDSEILSTIKAAVNLLADHGYTGWRWANTDPYAGQRGLSSKARRFKSRPWGE